MPVVAPASDQHDDRERARGHHRVRADVEQRRARTFVGRRLHADEHVSRVRDRLVGEHALHVGLGNGRDAAYEQRQHGEPEDCGSPVDLVEPERADEDT